MHKRLGAPSPALVVALIALFVALSGTAVAASPIVKRALFADNAGKLEKKTLSAVVQMAAVEGAKLPSPASTSAGLVSQKTASDALAPDGERDISISCDAGQKVVGGGFSSTGPVLAFDARPTSEVTWSIYLVNLSLTAAANVSVYAVCLA